MSFKRIAIIKILTKTLNNMYFIFKLLNSKVKNFFSNQIVKLDFS